MKRRGLACKGGGHRHMPTSLCRALWVGRLPHSAPQTLVVLVGWGEGLGAEHRARA